jgi:hypothetical protein
VPLRATWQHDGPQRPRGVLQAEREQLAACAADDMAMHAVRMQGLLLSHQHMRCSAMSTA